MTNEIQTQPKTPVRFSSNGSVDVSNLDEAWRLSVAISKSKFAPKGLERTEDVLAAVLLGKEIGIGPMSAIQNIAVINGRPSIYGDAALALVRASGDLEVFKETIEGEGDNRRAVCRLKRVGFDEAVEEFSVADAKAAQLWGKPGPWSQYPGRMLKFRARGFALRDHFGDILKGLRTFKEAIDIEAEPVRQMKTVSPFVQATATEPAAELPDAPMTPEQPETKPAPKPKRRRRTKAELEAARAAEAQTEPEPKPEPETELTETQPVEGVTELPMGNTYEETFTLRAGDNLPQLLEWLAANRGFPPADFGIEAITLMAATKANAVEAIIDGWADLPWEAINA